MTNNPERPYLFISYARADYEFVQRLISDLQAQGIAVWIDRDKIKLGNHNWEKAIREALGQSHTVLLVASPASFKSENVAGEIAYAEMQRCNVFPVWAAGEQWIDCVPLNYSKRQYLDMRGERYAENRAALWEALGNPSPPAPLPQGERGVMPSPLTPLPNAEDGRERGSATSVVTAMPQGEGKGRTGEPRNPYKALRAFTDKDAGDFFGRTAFVATLVRRLKAHPQFLAVVGASGAGKSSVVMAGLLPALRAGEIPGSEAWVILPPVKPSSRPLEQLADSLKSAHKESSIAAILDDLATPDGYGLYRLARTIPRPPEARVVLFIDQFEEVFTQTTDPAAREQFLSVITTAAQEPNGVLSLVLTLRADFSDRPLAYADLGRLMKDHSEPILPLTVADLRQVVEAPAALPDVQVALETGLASELVYEARGQIGGLPLLQFTLDQVFRARDGDRLTLAAYRALGGLTGALRSHAEQTYAALTDDGKRAARQLFLRLIEPGATEQDTTRRRPHRAEFESADAAHTTQMNAVIETFVAARLLTAEADTLEVAHEALIREWTRLGDWLREYRNDVLLQQAISEAAAAWLAGGKPSARLYRDMVLDEAQAWAARNVPSATEAAFLAAGVAERERIAREERERQARELELAKRAEAAERDRAVRFRRAAWVAAVIAGLAVLGVMVAVIVAINAGIARRAADEQLGTATVVQGQAVAQAATALVVEGQAVAQLGTAGVQATLSELDRRELQTLVPGIAAVPPTVMPTLALESRYETATAVAQRYLAATTTPAFTFEDGVEMVLVPAGCFLMGSAVYTNEQPVHQVCFEQPFWIDKYEVTNEQFNRLKGVAGRDSEWTQPKRPRETISWVEARDFCEDNRSGNTRLPTEAEWEYAARGADSRMYPWGSKFVDDNAVYGGNSNRKTADVGSKLGGISWVGAHDMAGNVWEWVNTIYDEEKYPYPYRTTDGRENTIYDDIMYRVIRGGSWFNTDRDLRSAVRAWVRIESFYVGFRCARSS